MSKFFINNNQINGENIKVTGEDVNHIINVLRKRKGDTLQLCDLSNGDNYLAEITEYCKENVMCKIVNIIQNNNESNVDLTIFQGIPKFDKMELIIQKATEIGVKKIIPVLMKRTVVKLDSKDQTKKIDRWRKIAEIAAKQSMRDCIPQIENIININEIINQINDFDIILIAYENEDNNSLKKELIKLKDKNTYKIAILIGPEGGIDEEELKMLTKNEKIRIVSLGKRILRTETAGLVMASNIFYELEK